MTVKRVALKDSQALVWLLEEVNKSSYIDKNDLLDLLNLVNAPANLQALFLVLENLPDVLDKAKTIQQLDERYLPETDLNQAIETCNLLIQCENELKKCAVLSPLFPDVSRSNWEQLLGIIGSNPLYSSLSFKSERPDLSEAYFQLQAQVLLASHVYTDSGNDLSDLENCFLSVRRLCEKENSKELQALPTQLMSADDYLALVVRARINSHTNNAGKILAGAYHGKKRRAVRKRGDRQVQTARLKAAIEEMEDYENPAALWTGDNFVPKGVLTEAESEEYTNYGGSAAEFTGGQDEVPIPAADERFISTHTLTELSFQGKQRSNQEALKNQLNPLGWNELNQFDIHILCGYLIGEAEATEDDPHNSFVRDCVSLMFWLSAPLERILSLRKFNGSPGQKSPEGLYLKGDRILIARLNSPGPQLESKSISRTSELAYHVEYHCNIPLPSIAHTESLLNACSTSSPLNLQHSSESAKLDEDFVDTVNRQIGGALGTLNRNFGTRLTVGRLSHYWIHALGREPKEDPPSSMLFFGHHERFMVARLHYTCAPAQRMESTYRRMCSKMLKELGHPDSFPDENFVNDPVYLGTPFCPLPESIKTLVKSLQQAVEQTRPIQKQFDKVKYFHNNYAIYTACLIAFATTYRAVKDPSLYENDIHFASGLGVISDKDDETFYHSRFVWLSETCRKQIVYYRRHLQRLYELFGLHSPSLFNLFKKLDLEGKPLNLFLFAYNSDSLEEMRPAIMGDFLKKYHNYSLPVNAHRHYLKYELLKSGCPVDAIEAMLGHWEQGQEPWNRFSNLHPREFCRLMDLHLTKILNCDEWVAIKGYDH